MSTSPAALALQYKDALNATGAFVVQPDGSVKMSADRGGGYAPPWVWAGAIPPASGEDAQSQALRIKLSTPASDPSSPWRDSVGYDAGGPFTKHSAWDQQTGSYEGGIDWGTLLGTIGVGSMFAAPALAGAFGGGGGAAGSASGAGTSAGAGSGAAAGAGGAKVGIASTLTGIGKNVATDVASNAAQNALGGGKTPQSGGSKTAEMMALLGGLLAGHTLANRGAANNVPPELSQLLQLGTQRATAQQPMFNAVNQGTFAMLPEFAKAGIAPPSPMNFTPSAQAPQAGGDSGGGMNPALIAALGGAGGVGLGGLLTGTNPYGAVVDGLKKLFGAGGPSSDGGTGGPRPVYGPPDPFADASIDPRSGQGGLSG